MMEALDRVRQDLIEESREQALDTRITVSVAESAALLSSFGVLSLVSRLGTLAAAALSSIPAWRRFDPLAVLYVSEEERWRRERDLRDAEAAEDREDEEVGRILGDD